MDNQNLIESLKNSELNYLNHEQALLLVDETDTAVLADIASRWRDQGFGKNITFSKKVFIPLTHLCRDVCHYCTFAKTPKRIDSAYLSADEVVKSAKIAAAQGCKEALFTLGEKPELRYSAARKALADMGFDTTLEYVAYVAKRVLDETGVIPHINAGCMTEDELALLRPVSASMGIMLESASSRLCEKGMPHYGSPDKDPEVRLATLENAGKQFVPFTTGILIGIGETRKERIESLLAIRDIHERYGHIQEVIVQNFRAKPDTKMVQAPEPDLDDLLWTLAVTRLIFGPDMSIQAPPNLSPGVLPQLVNAGLNDWGGVSPVTPDFVNPEAPWPHLEQLATETELAGKYLHERLTIYPKYALSYKKWLDVSLQKLVLQRIDGQGFPRVDDWTPGEDITPPKQLVEAVLSDKPCTPSNTIRRIVEKAISGNATELTEPDITALFEARDDDFTYICQQANEFRQKVNGDRVSYVVNRNINYTNVCYFKCQFCAFSKGKQNEALRGRAYDLDDAEIQRRTIEAWQRGATEVCMQGGIHPDYTGEHYIHICRLVKQAVPDMHIHAFSPLEVWQGAKTMGLSVKAFLMRLKEAGLATLPGTAAEVLDDEVRSILCPDKINTEQWLEVMQSAHELGLKTTATIMFGHVDGYQHWARHLIRIRDLQAKTGGFTEFVPLPFVASEAPIYLRGKSRKGPTFRESVLMHAVSRLVFHGLIDHIQASWVKLGPEGVKACLNAGADDLGGTLMNESITRAAGATHGQETSPQAMEQRIKESGRIPLHRTTVYQSASDERHQTAWHSEPLCEISNTPLKRRQRKDKREKAELIVNML